MTGSDWVQVRLTSFGEERAQGGELRIQEGNGGKGFVFRAGEAQRVTRAFDWEKVLKSWTFNGHALFELVSEDEAAAADAAETAEVASE
jgi:hypothetical protein